VGFEGITVELVSERSGVARSTMYRHWRSMPEVLRDAFAEQAGQRPPSADADDGLSALTAYAQAVAVGLTQVWGRAAASLAGSALGDPEQKAVQRVFVDGTRRDLREIVDIGHQTGELDASADPRRARRPAARPRDRAAVLPLHVHRPAGHRRAGRRAGGDGLGRPAPQPLSAPPSAGGAPCAQVRLDGSQRPPEHPRRFCRADRRW
jgi:AcrR family transcriptional regulator